MKKITLVLVDDEPLARKKVRTLLRDEADFEIIGECANGDEAIVRIPQLKPDAVFLDIQMPGMSGFDVVRRLPQEERPILVFVTAYDQFALDAFEAHALDYLLKPFDYDRLAQTLERVRKYVAMQQTNAASDKIDALLNSLSEPPKIQDRFMVKSGSDIYFLKTSEIDWIEAAGNYVNVHLGKKTHLLRETMSSIEGKLDSGRFVRNHRSQIVNIDKIKKLSIIEHGEYIITLNTGKELSLSRTYRERFLNRFERGG